MTSAEYAIRSDCGRALENALAILKRQSVALKELGVMRPLLPQSAEIVQLLSGVNEGGDVERMRLLALLLEEIAARDSLLDPKNSAIQAIERSAFVHAMHRMLTAIDVALGCSEEAAELSSEADVIRAARECAVALRLIYHFANEFNDLASLAALIALMPSERVDCGAAFRRTFDGLSHVACDARVEMKISAPPGVLFTLTSGALLERTLSYLLVNAILTPGVRKIECSLRTTMVEGRPLAEFVIAGEGGGASLRDRSAATALSDESLVDSGDPDASGFAVARRLSKALSGALMLDCIPGGGDTVILRLPIIPGA